MSTTNQSESIDWSVVLNHPRIKRKYGARTDGSVSSRSSVSSGLTEQFSSSSSDSSSVEGNAYIRSPHAQREAVDAPSGPLRKARYIVAKRRAKKLFLRFTTPSRKNRRVPTWRRRKEAADGLLEIVAKEAEGEDLVGRRFTKTALRQESVTRAILSLGDEEYRRDAGSPGPRSQYVPLTVNRSGAAVRLLKIVMAHSEGSSFFEDSVPRALEAKTEGSATILLLATTFPRFLERVDPRVLFTYSRRMIEEASDSSLRWLRAIRLLDVLMSHMPPTLPERRNMQLLMARTAIKHISKFLDPESDVSGTEMSRDTHILRLIIVLQTSITSLLQAEKNNHKLEDMFPSDSNFARSIVAFRTIVTRPSTPNDEHRVERALALKLLALLSSTQQARNRYSKLTTTNWGPLAWRWFCHTTKTDGKTSMEL